MKTIRIPGGVATVVSKEEMDGEPQYFDESQRRFCEEAEARARRAAMRQEPFRGSPMHHLYASKPGVERKLVATFDSEQQLLAYVGWATLQANADGTSKFEQGSALAGYQRWEQSASPLTGDDPAAAPHNPSPSML